MWLIHFNILDLNHVTSPLRDAYIQSSICVSGFCYMLPDRTSLRLLDDLFEHFLQAVSSQHELLAGSEELMSRAFLSLVLLQLRYRLFTQILLFLQLFLLHLLLHDGRRGEGWGRHGLRLQIERLQERVQLLVQIRTLWTENKGKGVALINRFNVE